MPVGLIEPLPQLLQAVLHRGHHWRRRLEKRVDVQVCPHRDITSAPVLASGMHVSGVRCLRDWSPQFLSASVGAVFCSSRISDKTTCRRGCAEQARWVAEVTAYLASDDHRGCGTRGCGNLCYLRFDSKACRLRHAGSRQSRCQAAVACCSPAFRHCLVHLHVPALIFLRIMKKEG